MNKKNIVCNTVSETAKNNRTVYNPMQFLEKIAETDCEKRGRGINRNYHYLEVAD